jgi:hypothetical protein
MIYTRKDFQKHIERIQIADFKLKPAVQAFLFIREFKSKQETIIISYRDYAPHGFCIDGISVNISFRKVESVIFPLYNRHNINEISDGTLSNVFQNLENVDYNLLESEVKDDDSFGIVKYEIEKIINNGVFPFFEKCNSLSDISDFLAFKSAEEISHYIQGAKLFPKTILILKLSNHPHFETKLLEFYEILKRYSQKKFIYLSYLNLFVDLFSEDLKV